MKGDVGLAPPPSLPGTVSRSPSYPSQCNADIGARHPALNPQTDRKFPDSRPRLLWWCVPDTNFCYDCGGRKLVGFEIRVVKCSGLNIERVREQRSETTGKAWTKSLSFKPMKPRFCYVKPKQRLAILHSGELLGRSP